MLPNYFKFESCEQQTWAKKRKKKRKKITLPIIIDLILFTLDSFNLK